MDRRLLGWALAVKARQRRLPPGRRLPVLWLFTDALRLADPLSAVRRLPRRPGLCGVVLRPRAAPTDGPGLAVLGTLAALCRRRGVRLVVAGDARLAARLGAGLHLRGGRLPPGGRRGRRALTSSAHDRPELLRARRAGASLVFLSPFAATASHPGARPLGAVRWSALARGGGAVAALGGIAAGSARRLPRGRLRAAPGKGISVGCWAVGAIGALS